MNDPIMLQLREIEKREHVKIVMAALTGSHSFGLSSNKSDLDIRFVYIHVSKRSYLSLRQPKEIIHLNESNLEMEGWDLYKAARLMQKSNPSLFETLASSFQLIDDSATFFALKELMSSHYSLKALGHHYFRMLSANNEKFSKLDMVDRKGIKTLIQALRSYIMLLYLLEKEELPSVSVWEVLDRISMDSAQKIWISQMFEAKQKENYSQRNFGGWLKIKGELSFLKNEISKLPEGKDMEHNLNQIIWKVLEQEAR